jgi:hypothetical protein
MENQTAIEWIETELSKLNNDISKFKTFKEYHKQRISLWAKAKAIEKHQIKKAFERGENTITLDAEEYYNETYLQ